MSDKDTCPKCGAEIDTQAFWSWRSCQSKFANTDDLQKTHVFWRCGRTLHEPGDTIHCIRRQLANALASNAELARALKMMQAACAEWAAEFTQQRRAMNWVIVNEAYLAADAALAKHKGAKP